tara:strand:+ start:1163 stop:1444 length:282 start_codon:yes stop_codon:yes gene_type:complete
MKYTINGKEYSELDISKRCADLMEVTVLIVLRDYSPCNNPADTWPIIEKCWGELMSVKFEYCALPRWQYLRHEHKCTKLVAACICFIELKEQE